MCIDFRKNQRCPEPVYIKGEAVERVGTYKYLGVVFDRRLNWKENINSVVKKVNPRMYFMRKLRSFGVNSDMLVTVYNAVICSLMFGSVCRGGNITKFDKGKLGKIVKKQRKKAGHVVGKPPECFKTLHEKRLYRQLMQILNDSTHPMRHYFDSRCSNKSGSFLLPITYTNHYKASFLPSALSVFNDSYSSH